MKRMTRLIAMLMSLVMLLGVAVSCANTSGPEDTTGGSASTTAPGNNSGEPAEETLYELDDLDEKYEFNETITIYMWNDWRMMEFYSDETGDIIDDAIYHRNIAVSSRLGVTFEYVEEPGDSNSYTTWIAKAENDWAADNEFDIYAGYSLAVPLLPLKNMTANLLEHETFNVNKPWWPEALTTECTINDRLYFCTGDIATSMLWYMVAMMYNKDLYDSRIQTGKTPMDMVDNDEWNLQNFLALVQDVYVDDGNGAKDNKDFFGATLFNTDMDSWQICAGITSLEKDSSGMLQISEAWQSQRCADICETVGNATQQPGILCGGTADTRDIFRLSQSVFHMDRVFIIPGADSSSSGPLEFSVGVVPVPKFDEAQEGYRTNLGNPYTLYAVNARSDSIEATVTTLEALASESYRSVTPAVFEVAMKVRYTDDPQVARMFDILKENVSFDVGKIYYYALEKLTMKMFRDVCTSGNPSGYLSTLNKSKRVIENKLKDINEAYSN